MPKILLKFVFVVPVKKVIEVSNIKRAKLINYLCKIFYLMFKLEFLEILAWKMSLHCNLYIGISLSNISIISNSFVSLLFNLN